MFRTVKFSTLQILLLAWLFICVLGGIETVLIYLFRPEVIQSNKFFLLPVMRIVNGIAAIILILNPGHLLLKRKTWSVRIFGYLIMMLLFVFVYLAFSVGQFQLAFLRPTMSLFLAGIGETIMTDLHHIATYYFFLLFIILGRDYFEERTAAIVKKEQIEGELSKTKLQVLQRQIQPHFLFNTLNNVVAIIDERKEVAQEMLVDLSELLRLSMEMDFTQKIPLAREIEIVSTYLSIEKKRFEHQLESVIHLDKNCENTPVPPFLLQPLAENAIKHGFKGGVKTLNLVISVKKEGDFVLIFVENNGASLSKVTYGIGLKNTQERLYNAYGDNFQFSVEQRNDKVINTIKISLM